MIKYICDKCGRECKSLTFENIPIKKTKYNFETKKIQLCEDCTKEYDSINDKLADIRLILIKDFINGT